MGYHDTSMAPRRVERESHPHRLALPLWEIYRLVPHLYTEVESSVAVGDSSHSLLAYSAIPWPAQLPCLSSGLVALAIVSLAHVQRALGIATAFVALGESVFAVLVAKATDKVSDVVPPTVHVCLQDASYGLWHCLLQSVSFVKE